MNGSFFNLLAHVIFVNYFWALWFVIYMLSQCIRLFFVILFCFICFSSCLFSMLKKDGLTHFYVIFIRIWHSAKTWLFQGKAVANKIIQLWFQQKIKAHFWWYFVFKDTVRFQNTWQCFKIPIFNFSWSCHNSIIILFYKHQ